MEKSITSSLSSNAIHKIERAVNEVNNGEFIIYVPVRVRVVNKHIKKIKEIKVELVQREL